MKPTNRFLAAMTYLLFLSLIYLITVLPLQFAFLTQFPSIFIYINLLVDIIFAIHVLTKFITAHVSVEDKGDGYEKNIDKMGVFF